MHVFIEKDKGAEDAWSCFANGPTLLRPGEKWNR